MRLRDRDNARTPLPSADLNFYENALVLVAFGSALPSFEGIGDHHAVHAGRHRGLPSQFRILKHQAPGRIHPHALGRKQEHIGRRFAVSDLVGGNNDREEVANSRPHQRPFNHVSFSARSDRYGSLAHQGSRVTDHRFDRRHLR